MLKALRFVQGAVAKKNYIPVLTHFKIQAGFIQSYNGAMSLCSPIPLNIDARPVALGLIKAIKACEDTVAIHLTPKGKLSIKSGGFHTFVECTEEGFPEVVPQGQTIHIQPGFLEVLKKLNPLTSEDAGRSWAQGILFRGCSAFATNNVVLAECWLGYTFPVQINIPQQAIQEILRINEEPERMQVADNTATFFFSGNRWLHTSLYSVEWPDMSRILDAECAPVAIPTGMWEAARKLVPFVDTFETLCMSKGKLHTHEQEGEGATAALEGLDVEGVVRVNVKHFLLLEHMATQIAYAPAPRPTLFYGDKLRGAILGMQR